jgi:hypothetical protein
MKNEQRVRANGKEGVGDGGRLATSGNYRVRRRITSRGTRYLPSSWKDSREKLKFQRLTDHYHTKRGRPLASVTCPFVQEFSLENGWRLKPPMLK